MLRIRRALPADAPAVAALGRALNLHLREPDEHFTAEAVLRDGFGAEPQFSVLLAERDGAAVGYLLLHEAYETAYAARGLYVCDIYVAPAARGAGVGRALMAAAAREAKARGRSFLWWAVKPWNADAQAFYQALGARSEPILACALAFEAFEALAAAGADPE